MTFWAPKENLKRILARFEEKKIKRVGGNRDERRSKDKEKCGKATDLKAKAVQQPVLRIEAPPPAKEVEGFGFRV